MHTKEPILCYYACCTVRHTAYVFCTYSREYAVGLESLFFVIWRLLWHEAPIFRFTSSHRLSHMAALPSEVAAKSYHLRRQSRTHFRSNAHCKSRLTRIAWLKTELQIGTLLFFGHDETELMTDVIVALSRSPILCMRMLKNRNEYEAYALV